MVLNKNSSLQCNPYISAGEKMVTIYKQILNLLGNYYTSIQLIMILTQICQTPLHQVAPRAKRSRIKLDIQAFYIKNQ